MSTSHVTDARKHPRYPIDGALELTVQDQQVRCQLNDISVSAISVTTDRPPNVGETVEIDVPGIGALQARVARVSDGTVALTLVNETRVQLDGVEMLARALG